MGWKSKTSLIAIALVIGCVSPSQAAEKPWTSCINVKISGGKSALVFEGQCSGQPMMLRGFVRSNGNFRLKGTLGPRPVMLSGSVPYKVKLSGKIGTATVKVSGYAVEGAAKLRGTINGKRERFRVGHLIWLVASVLPGFIHSPKIIDVPTS